VKLLETVEPIGCTKAPATDFRRGSGGPRVDVAGVTEVLVATLAGVRVWRPGHDLYGAQRD